MTPFVKIHEAGMGEGKSAIHPETVFVQINSYFSLPAIEPRNKAYRIDVTE